MENIEVEIRSFITEEKYNELKSFFDKNAQLISEDKQETHYFNCDEDLRIQQNDHYSKIWLKKGKLHDDAREEIEIKIDKENFKEAQKLFDTLGYKVEIKWFRKRLKYDFDNIKVCLDHTKGYGYIIELEILSNEQNKNKDLEKLKSKFKELNIEISPKEEFKKQFNNYKENWRELIQ